MRYPSFLKKDGTIGVIAPSFGVSGYPYEPQYENGVKKLKRLGLKIKEAKHIRGIVKCASAPAKDRANDVMEMFLDPEVDFIMSVAGGELMNQILPYIDFKTLSHCVPKYVMGYSDNTHLTFTLPVFADMAALYGNHVGAFGQRRWDNSVQDAYDLITGKKLSFESYPKYEIEDKTKEAGKALSGYNLTEKVEIKAIDNAEEVSMSGRLIGGCLDCLAGMVGTPFGNIDAFLEKYKEDGFIWFMESYSYDVVGVNRVLTQLKQAGWFKYCKGFVFGRPINGEDFIDFTQADSYEPLKEFNVPIIYGCDIGHIPPRWTIISGAYATVTKKGDVAEISYTLK